MLDINLFRTDKGGDPEIVRKSQKARFADETLVDKVVSLDQEWIRSDFRLNKARAERKKLTGEFAAAKKAGQPTEELSTKLAELKTEIDTLVVRVKELDKERLSTLSRIGNLIAPRVPISDNEDDNEVVWTWGEAKHEDWMLNHVRLLEKLGAVDCERGRKIAGNRGYYLVGPGVLLNQALINYGLHFMLTREHPSTLLQPPYFMKQEVMAKCAQLEDFAEMLYTVKGETEDSFLIATAEQPIAARHSGERLDPASLPRRYCGFSSCFRKEVGRHGVDTLGIFRIHQFEKIEQFCITMPDKSWEMFEEMIGNSRAFYESLKIPYRVVAIVSGALNNAAAMKYDLEGWFPAGAQYRELVSCSNCTDYQPRDVDVRLATAKKDSAPAPYVHMLNSTLVACERCMCALVENYQTPEGVVIPEVLRPFMGGMEFIPFIKEEEAAPAKPATGADAE